MDLSFISAILALLDDLEKLIVNDSDDEPLRNTAYNEANIHHASQVSSWSVKYLVLGFTVDRIFDNYKNS